MKEFSLILKIVLVILALSIINLYADTPALQLGRTGQIFICNDTGFDEAIDESIPGDTFFLISSKNEVLNYITPFYKEQILSPNYDIYLYKNDNKYLYLKIESWFEILPDDTRKEIKSDIYGVRK